MNDDQQDHAWFRERIAAALADGLEPSERQRFEAHAAGCAACAAELASLKELETRMSTLFAHPAAGFEDRVIASLRNVREQWRPRIRIHPAVAKAATGIAAAVLVAGFGYFAQQHILNEEAPHATGRATLASSSDGRGLGYDYSIAATQPATDRYVSLRYPTNWPDVSQMRDESGRRQKDQRRWYEDAEVGWDKQPFGGANRENAAQAKMRGTNTYQGSTGASGGFALNGGEKPADAMGARETPNSVNDSVLMPSDANAPAGQSAGDRAAHNVKLNAKSGSGTMTLSGGSLVVSDADGDGAADRPHRADAAANFFFKPTQLAMSNGAVADGTATEAGKSVQQNAPGATPALVPELVNSPAAPAQAGAASVTKGVVLGREMTEINRAQETTLVTAFGVASSPAVQAPPHEPATTTSIARKVIRNGQVEFEVDRFDSAYGTISKLTSEAGGYIGTTDSEKLPNGKVKGTITLRVPPDRLDTLITELRGIGDLKSQKLDANDVTKHYTDLESQLRADRAMEERLLGVIKDGKGQIKDLLAAEKELGTWREKIENIVGEMRYLDSQVAMSTLVVTLYERDIKTPATATQTETIDTGMEVADVEKARSDALKAIDEAKGRVIQSDLKRFDAGQFGATIVAEVPPDAAGAMLDRLKQIGKLARLDVQRRQTSDTNADSTAPKKLEKKDTRLNLSIYNLANVAPRTTTTLNLAADDVEKTYHAIQEAVSKAGGRVISSDLARTKADKPTGTIGFDVPAAQGDAVMNALRAMGEVMRLSVTDNPDVNNVTTAKRGFSLQLVATASIAPRETTTLQIASAKVGEAREKILAAAAAAGARVLVSQLNESDPNNPNAAIEVDVSRANLPAIEKAMADAGDTVSRNVTRSSDTENTLDTKVKLQISLLPADRLPPRETTALTIETGDVESALGALQSAATSAGGKVLDANESKERDGSTRATLVVETPLAGAASLVDQAKQSGTVRAAQSMRNLQSPPGKFAKARVELTLVTPETIVQPGTGPLATIRNGLATSVKALLWSLELVVIGACTVLPFVLVLWTGWKLMKRRKAATA